MPTFPPEPICSATTTPLPGAALPAHRGGEAAFLRFWLLLSWLLLASVGASLAQQPGYTLTCTGLVPPSSLQKRHCEIRELSLPAPPAGTPLTVDACPSGSITVRGWNGTTVRVRARVVGRAATAAAAKALAAAVRIGTPHHTLRASRANASTEGWEVSYEVLVPTRTSLTLLATTGGISLENVQGNLRCETTTGRLDLTGVGGDVRGKTTTGALVIRLTGPAWEGPGLDVSTVTGDISWLLPATYSATVVARTTRGRVTAELPTTRKQVLARSLTATLGKGGALLRASTTNGNVQVQQAGSTPPPEPAAE
ncbi:DUF4097 family beta strand repeat-containing protein [Hymenobacter weizhouensis]|uniref:DUF4097 family beta strand repeat-containing protein n=1 Tax=Hymenobacter sp. YIM 151500-1 TaxID=2987689 RepID=UPI0022273180|nr:DUF4097 domain-containing protein [Hymenobacter sp. YIM 151500-1]UYZ64691.1 DUF4097 domain-containing protein [Hymenobacter sp. YIM 151500-1]